MTRPRSPALDTAVVGGVYGLIVLSSLFQSFLIARNLRALPWLDGNTELIADLWLMSRIRALTDVSLIGLVFCIGLVVFRSKHSRGLQIAVAIVAAGICVAIPPFMH